MIGSEVGVALGGVAAVVSAFGAWRTTKHSKDVKENVGRANGNGPTNEALHVVIEMLKEQNATAQTVAANTAVVSRQLDELTSIVSDHMHDPHAHSGVKA